MAMPQDRHQVPAAFLEVFRELVIAFQPRHLDRDAAAVYWAALGSAYPIPVLRESAQALRQSNPFFPNTAEWFATAQQIHHARILEGRADEETEPCEWCDRRGLVRVMYRSGEPWDLAICTCVAGRFYRAAGPDFVRITYALTPEQRVAGLDEFDDDDDIEDPSIVADVGVFVYAFVAGEFLKIGFSRNLTRRYRDLSAARGRDGSFIGRARCRSVREARLLERWLQHRYGDHLLDGEWFTAVPAVVAELRDLLRDPAAVARALEEAHRAQTKLAPSAAQQNARVIGAVAIELLKTVTVGGRPPEAIAPELVQRCATLHIACDEHVARRALRSAAWRLGIS